MTRYRKVPIEVEAIKWTGKNIAEVYALVNGRAMKVAEDTLTVVTIDGNNVHVPLGAYVVMDPKGYPYPCDAEIFEATHYEVFE